ncbi:hypothetical protein HNQ92_001050 [Rhabdobacter roseus]|uniref:Uncharacterized protein n=1 Tax=Rhabdobacter roseus TaxID=1655419 RepID=A0A840THI2_9BACT|nr:hypothetical protein [Rhabdobacter roseus]MBB5282924.1 hypothetical protein [Rhabdobacter roseus]
MPLIFSKSQGCGLLNVFLVYYFGIPGRRLCGTLHFLEGCSFHFRVVPGALSLATIALFVGDAVHDGGFSTRRPVRGLIRPVLNGFLCTWLAFPFL